MGVELGIDVSGVARLGRTPVAVPAQAPVSAARDGRPATRWLGWFAIVAIGSSLGVTVATSLGRATWTGPALPMPRTGPPFELASWHLTLASATIALWLSAVAGGLGLAAALVAVRRGARPPLRLLLVAAAVIVAVLTVLPPAGSTDPLDYMAFGRMVVLGHSPY